MAIKNLLKTGFILLFFLGSTSGVEKCWSENRIKYVDFGIRSSRYDSEGNKIEAEEASACEPVVMWMLMRQDVSWPLESTLMRLKVLKDWKESIVKNHEEGRGELCKADLQKFKEAVFPPEGAEPEKLTEEGENSVKRTAKMLKDSFPSSFVKPFSPEDYQIRYAGLPGVRGTAEAFTKAVFGEEFNFNQIRKPAAIDAMLDGPNICDAWKKENFHGRYWGVITSFIMTKHSSLRKEVSTRLGFKKTLEFDEIVLFYVGCSLQKAMQPQLHASWCFAFTTDQLHQLNHMEDSFYYKACGPGENPSREGLNKIMTCPLYQDLIAQLSRGVRKRKLQNTFYFTDEKTLLLLIYGLGYIEDTSDTTTTEQKILNTSKLAPFGANLAAVLYKCGKEDFRVAFYLNGKIMKRPGHDEEMETWDGFSKRIDKQYFSSLLCKGDPCPEKTTGGKTEDTTFKVFFEN